MDDEFVAGQDNGRIWDLSDKLGNESSVKSCISFLHSYQPARLEEVLVLAAFLPQPCPDDLWKP